MSNLRTNAQKGTSKQVTHRALEAHFRPEETLRVGEIRGEEYVITSGILLVEGVIQGAKADNPELALASEYGKVPGAWNGRPVVINHPKLEGDYVPAGTPEVWEEYTVGWLFNTDITEQGKLRSELWLNKEWLSSNDDYAAVLSRIQNNETIEVSTGLFCDLEETEGFYQGEKYFAIWRNVIPDHLAILPNVQGACSVADGCGTNRTNSTEQAEPKVQNTEMKGNCMCDEKQPGVMARMINFVSSMRANLSGLSSNDLHAALAAALMKVNPYSAYIVAVYDDRVVYETYKDGFGWVILQRAYTMEGTTINFTGEDVEVRPVTDFIPVQVTVTNEKPAGSITVNATSEEATSVTPTVPAAAVEEPPAISEVPTEQATAEPEVIVQDAAQPTAQTPEVLEAINLRNQMRQDLITQIQQKSTTPFVLQELEAMSTDMLNKLAASIRRAETTQPTPKVHGAVDYTGMASPQVRASAETATTAPMPVFPRTK